jgi:hypothetical protein
VHRSQPKGVFLHGRAASQDHCGFDLLADSHRQQGGCVKEPDPGGTHRVLAPASGYITPVKQGIIVRTAKQGGYGIHADVPGSGCLQGGGYEPCRRPLLASCLLRAGTFADKVPGGTDKFTSVEFGSEVRLGAKQDVPVFVADDGGIEAALLSDHPYARSLGRFGLLRQETASGQEGYSPRSPVMPNLSQGRRARTGDGPFPERIWLPRQS